MREVLSVKEVARILDTTPGVLRTLLSAKRIKTADLPPSFRIGRRRVFLRRSVYAWLRRKVAKPGHIRSIDSFQPKKEQSVMSELFEVSEGDVFCNEDNGNEMTVTRLYAERGYALLENQDGDELTMSVGRLLSAIEDGELIRVAELEDDHTEPAVEDDGESGESGENEEPNEVD